MRVHHPSLVAIWSPLSQHISIWAQRWPKGRRKQQPIPSATQFFTLATWSVSASLTPKGNPLLSPTLITVLMILLTLLFVLPLILTSLTHERWIRFIYLNFLCVYLTHLLFHHHFLFYLTSFLYLPFTCYIDPRLIILRRYNIGFLPFPISLPYFLLLHWSPPCHCYTPNNLLQINFSLVFPQFGVITRLLFMWFVHPRLILFNSQPTGTFDTTFLNLLDDMLSSISTSYMRKLLLDIYNILPNASDLLIYILLTIFLFFSLQLITSQPWMQKSPFLRVFFFLHCTFQPETIPIETIFLSECLGDI